MSRLIYCKKLIILFLIFNLITISSISIYSGKTSINNLENNVLYDKLIKQIGLKPGEDFFIRFISEDVELECENVPPVA
ncbi:MAG: hypothetical protein JSV67_02015, partial [Thermoplasmatales archaeon]